MRAAVRTGPLRGAWARGAARRPGPAAALPRALSSGGASSGGHEDEEREFHVLKKAHSINSGVALSRGVSIGQEEREQKKKSTLKHSLITGDVHGSYRTLQQVETWRKRPLFRRAGKNLTFTSGQEAAELLVDEVRRRDPYQIDFLQAVQETSQDVSSMFEEAPKLAWVFKQLMEPERLLTFRVPWTDDNGNARINRGYRIQYSSALGHYHGGLRFHPQLSHGSIRMLGWEQTLKNAVTGFPLGGSRGGSDFDPMYKSDAEIRRFCQSFMHELSDFIGAEVDTLETDLGVGKLEMASLEDTFRELDDGAAAEEIDELFGACEIFPEASGFGAVYFAERAMQAAFQTTLKDKVCLLSGSGTLARSIALKLIEKGAVPVTFSDETGYVYDEKGFTKGDIDNIAHIKAGSGTLKEYAKASHKKFAEAGTLWEQVRGDIAFPCNIQGELNADDATLLADNGCMAVFESSDRGCTPNAQEILEERQVLYAPGKVVNCGSVIASHQVVGRSVEELNAILEERMPQIHDRVLETADKYGRPGSLRAGANLYAFVRIANSPMYVQ